MRYQIRSHDGRIRFHREADSLPFGPSFCDHDEAEGFALYLWAVHATEPQLESLDFLARNLRAFRAGRST